MWQSLAWAMITVDFAFRACLIEVHSQVKCFRLPDQAAVLASMNVRGKSDMLHLWGSQNRSQVRRSSRQFAKAWSLLAPERLEDRLLLTGNGFIEDGIPVAGAFAPTPDTLHAFMVTDVTGDSDNNGQVNDPNLILEVTLSGPSGPFHGDTFIEVRGDGQLYATIDDSIMNAGFINATTTVFQIPIQLRGGDRAYELGFTVIRTTPGMSGELTVVQLQGGTASGLPLIGRFVLDTEPPTEPPAPDLITASDTGISDDNITGDMTPTFEIADVEPGVAAQLYRNGVPVGSPVVNTSWDRAAVLVTDTSDFPGDGIYSYTARLIDDAGNIGNESFSLDLTFDTHVATPATPVLKTESDTGTDHTDRITYDSSPTFLLFNIDSEAKVELLRDGNVVPSTITLFSDHLEITDLLAPDGTHTYAGRVTDLAANSADSLTITVTIDTTVGDPTPGAPGTPVFATQYVLTPANIDDGHIPPGQVALQPWTTTFDRSTQTTWFTVEQGSYLGHFDPATGHLELYDVSLGKTLTTNPHGVFFDFKTHITPRVWFTHRNANEVEIPELSYLDLERNVLVTYNFEELLQDLIAQSEEAGLHAIEVDSRGHVWVSGEDASLVLELTFAAPDANGNIDPSSEMARVIVHRKLATDHGTESTDGSGSGAGDGSGGGQGGTTTTTTTVDDGLTHPHGLTVAVSEVTGETFVWITELKTGRIVLLRPGSGQNGEDQWAEFDVNDFLDLETGDPDILDGIARTGHALFVAIDNNETPGIPEDDKIIVSDPGDRRAATSQADGLRGIIRVLDPGEFLSSPDTVTTATIRSWTVPQIPGESATENFAGTNQSFLDREGILYFIDRTSGVGRFDPAEDSAIVSERTVSIDRYTSTPSASFELDPAAERDAADIRTDYTLQAAPVVAQNVTDNTIDHSPITGLDQYEVALPGLRRPDDRASFRGLLNAGGVLYGSASQADALMTTVFAETSRRKVAAVALDDGARMFFQVYRNGSVILTHRAAGSLIDQQVNLTAQLAVILGVNPASIGIDGDTSAIIGGNQFVHVVGKRLGGGLIEYRFDIAQQTWSIHMLTVPTGVVFAGKPILFSESNGVIGAAITTAAGHLLIYRLDGTSPTDLTALSSSPDAVRVYSSVGIVEDAGRVYFYGANQTGAIVEYSYSTSQAIPASLTTRVINATSRPAGQVARDTWIFQNVEAVVTDGVRQVFGVDGTSRLVHLVVSGPDSGFAENITQSIADTFSDNVNRVDVQGNDRATGYFPFQQIYAGRVFTDLLVLKDPRDGQLYVYGTNSGDLIMFSRNAGGLWRASNLTQDILSGTGDRTPANFVFGAPGGYVLPNGDRSVVQINAEGELIEYFLDQRVGTPTTQNVNRARGNLVEELASLTADPQISLGDTTDVYVADSPAVVIAGVATLTDMDSPNFAGGSLLVCYAGGAVPTDQLQVRNQGTAAGQIGVTENTITYRKLGGGTGGGSGTGGGTGGVRVIGTFSGGTSLQPLVIILNANATLEAVQALLRSITFQSAASPQQTAPRAIEFVFTDGDGGRSEPATATIQVRRPNSATIIELPDTVPVTAHGRTVLITPAADLKDTDTVVLHRATLVVTITGNAAPTDLLQLASKGRRNDDVSVKQGQLRVGNRVIGKVQGGRNGVPLTLTFNQQASLANVRTAIRQLRFSTRGRTAWLRTISFVLTDGAGLSNGSVTRDVLVTRGR